MQDNLAEIVREGGVEKLMEAELILQVRNLSSLALPVAAPRGELSLIMACFGMLLNTLNFGFGKVLWASASVRTGYLLISSASVKFPRCFAWTFLDRLVRGC
jgi:hypothetical protein